MRHAKRLGYGCVVAAALATVGQIEAATPKGAFTENTNYATPGRSPGAPTDTDHAPYGWIGYNGAHTWELYRKYEQNSYTDGGGDVTMDQLGTTITNDPAQVTHAIVHNETANFSTVPSTGVGGGAWNGPGLWVGPNGLNAFPTDSQLLVANPVSGGAGGTTNNMEIRIGFVTTANLQNFVYNPAAGVGGADDGGDGRAAVQNKGTRRTSHSDFYGGFQPGPGADLVYLHVALDPTGTLTNVNGYMRSGDNMSNESAVVSGGVTQTGNVGPGPYAISAQLVANASSPTGWTFVEHIGGWTGTFDLPDLTADPSGLAFTSPNGMFDPTKVTPAIYAQDSSGGDYADADVYATIPGDATLDGKVSFDDLVVLARHYGQMDVGFTGGDFDGSGKVDFADLVILARNYGKAPTAMQLAQFDPAFRDAVEAAFAEVPEPATFSLLFLPAMALLLRRRTAR